MLTNLLCYLFRFSPALRSAALEADRALYNEDNRTDATPLLQEPADEIHGTLSPLLAHLIETGEIKPAPHTCHRSLPCSACAATQLTMQRERAHLNAAKRMTHDEPKIEAVLNDAVSSDAATIDALTEQKPLDHRDDPNDDGFSSEMG